MLTASLRAGTVEWLSAVPTAGGIELRRFEAFDDGNEDFLDVYQFTPMDGDEYAGEGVLVGHFAGPREVLDGAGAHGALLDRWVNRGVIQDEYADMKTAGD